VQAFLELAASRGAPQGELLHRAGIETAELEDRDTRIPFSSYIAMVRAAKELCADPAIALHFGEAIDCGKYSIVGLIGGACETVMDAFTQVNRYTRLAVDYDLGEQRFGMEHVPGGFWVIDNRRNANETPEMTETWLAGMGAAVRRLTDKRVILRAEVSFPPPAYRGEFERIVGAPIAFDSGRNAALFDASWLTHRLASSSRYAFGLLSTHADALLTELETATTVRGRVEAVLLPILHTGETGMDAVAAKMGVSRQTLLRKLKAEGVTFEKVLDGLRHRLAVDYLAGKKVSVNETAYLVGFSDPASFSRAFKRWTGTSPRKRPT
jgi:AraC-like DNA-binding protein